MLSFLELGQKTEYSVPVNVMIVNSIKPSASECVCYLGGSGEIPLNSGVSQLQLLLSFCIPYSLTQTHTQ